MVRRGPETTSLPMAAIADPAVPASPASREAAQRFRAFRWSSDPWLHRGLLHAQPPPAGRARGAAAVPGFCLVIRSGASPGVAPCAAPPAEPGALDEGLLESVN